MVAPKKTYAHELWYTLREILSHITNAPARLNVVYSFASVISSKRAQDLLSQLARCSSDTLESTKTFVSANCTFEKVFCTPRGELPALSSGVRPMEKEVSRQLAWCTIGFYLAARREGL